MTSPVPRLNATNEADRAEAERFVRSMDADPAWIEEHWDNLFGQALRAFAWKRLSQSHPGTPPALTEGEGGAIAALRRHHSAALRVEPAAPSYRFAPLPHIARFLPSLPVLLLCAAICVAADFALWRLHHG